MENLREVVKDNLTEEVMRWSGICPTQDVTFGYYDDGTVTSEYGHSWNTGWVSHTRAKPGWFSEDNEELGEDDLEGTIEYMLDEMGL